MAIHRGNDPPVPGSRAKRIAQAHADGHDVKKRKVANGDTAYGDEAAWVDPVSRAKRRGYTRSRRGRWIRE